MKALLAVALFVALLGAIVVKNAETTVVTYVIDGDTVVIDSGEHVRVAVIDSCERGSPGGVAATAQARQLLDGQPVTLVPRGARDHDQYGRLLRAVIMPDGRDFGIEMVRQLHTGVYDGHIDAYPDYVDRVRAADTNGRTC